MRTALLSRRARLAGAVAFAAALGAPAAAQATLPATVNTVKWDVRHSWVDYVTNPLWYAGLGQGTQVRTASNGGTATVNTSYGFKNYGGGYTTDYYGSNFAKSTDGGSPRTIVAKGGLDYDVVPHGIDISIKNVRVVATSATTEKLVIDATYVPSSGGSTVTLTGISAFNVAANGVATLTAAGAQIFNGGTTERSYKTGDAFGAVYYG